VFSGYAAIPRQNADTVAREFVLNIILKTGTPKQILTDQGSIFLSDLLNNVCKLLRIKKLNTTAFRTESNGGLERSHRVLAEYLRHYIDEDQTNWDEGNPTLCTCVCTTLQYIPLQGIHHSNWCMVSSGPYRRRCTKHPAHSIVKMTTF
jgi:hypothetical protein